MTDQAMIPIRDSGSVDPDDEAAIHALLASAFGEPSQDEEAPEPEADEFAAEALPADFWQPESSPKRPAGRTDSSRPPSKSPARARRTARRQERRRRWKDLSDQGVEICAHYAEKPSGFVPPRSVRRRLARLHEAGRVAVSLDEAKAVWAAVDTQGWRADRYWRTLAVFIALHRLSAWETGLIQATQARIAEVADWLLGQWAAIEGHPVARLAARNKTMTQQRVSDTLAWAQAEGLLECLLPGVSKERLGHTHGRAGAYALLLPAPTTPEAVVTEYVDQSQGTQEKEGKAVPPEASALGQHGGQGETGKVLSLPTHPYRGENRFENGECLASEIPRARDIRRGDQLWNRRCPSSSREQEKLTARIMRYLGWIDVSVGRLTRELTEFYQAGWCAAAILHAYDYRPDGKFWFNRTDKVRSRAGVVRHRLAAWRDEAGTVLPTPIPSVAKYARVSNVDLSYVKPPTTETPYLGDVDTEARRREREAERQARTEKKLQDRIAREHRRAKVERFIRNESTAARRGRLTTAEHRIERQARIAAAFADGQATAKKVTTRKGAKR